jgi:hypothetical protein
MAVEGAEPTAGRWWPPGQALLLEFPPVLWRF